MWGAAGYLRVLDEASMHGQCSLQSGSGCAVTMTDPRSSHMSFCGSGHRSTATSVPRTSKTSVLRHAFSQVRTVVAEAEAEAEGEGEAEAGMK